MKRLLLPALLLTTLTACTAAPAGTLPALPLRAFTRTS